MIPKSRLYDRSRANREIKELKRELDQIYKTVGMDSDEYFKILFDYTYEIFRRDIEGSGSLESQMYGVEEYNIEGVTAYIAEEMYMLSNRKDPPLRVPSSYLKSLLPIYIRNYYQEFKDTSDINELNDYESNKKLQEMSGVKDYTSSEYDKVELSDQMDLKFDPTSIPSYVLNKYCMIQEYSVEYKFIKLSFYLSVVSDRVKLFGLGEEWSSYIRFLLNAYHAVFNRLVERELNREPESIDEKGRREER